MTQFKSWPKLGEDKILKPLIEEEINEKVYRVRAVEESIIHCRVATTQSVAKVLDGKKDNKKRKMADYADESVENYHNGDISFDP